MTRLEAMRALLVTVEVHPPRVLYASADRSTITIPAKRTKRQKKFNPNVTAFQKRA